MSTSSVPTITGTGSRARPFERASSFGVILLRVLLWPARMLKSRREFAKLAALSDRELRDIGLTRQDLRDATALPRDEDPTGFLAWAAAERNRVEWARRRGRADEAGRASPHRDGSSDRKVR